MSKEKPLTMKDLEDTIERVLGQVKSDKERKDLKDLLVDLKDGTVGVAKATTILTLRGAEYGWSFTKPFLSRSISFVKNCWTEAKSKNDDK